MSISSEDFLSPLPNILTSVLRPARVSSSALVSGAVWGLLNNHLYLWCRTCWLLAFSQLLLLYMSSPPLANQIVLKANIKVYKTNICEWALCKLMSEGGLDSLFTPAPVVQNLVFYHYVAGSKPVWRLQSSVLPGKDKLPEWLHSAALKISAAHWVPGSPPHHHQGVGWNINLGRAAVAQVWTACPCRQQNKHFVEPSRTPVVFSLWLWGIFTNSSSELKQLRGLCCNLTKSVDSKLQWMLLQITFCSSSLFLLQLSSPLSFPQAFFSWLGLFGSIMVVEVVAFPAVPPLPV